MFTISLSPAGTWLPLLADDAPPADAALARAFAESPSAGLLALVKGKADLAPPAVWLQQHALTWLSRLCHQPPETDGLPAPLQADGLETMLLQAPPMRGGEYLSLPILEASFSDFHDHLRGEMRTRLPDAMAWLRSLHPALHTLGRVSFHLAENPRNPDKPFAFMATYASGLSQAGRVQHLPLGQALKEFATAGGKPDPAKLRQLLDPIHIASQASKLAKTLLDSGAIFVPQAWGANDAYAFLQDAPLLENAGLQVRLPDWWAARPKVRAQATVGASAASSLGLDALMSFDVGAALGDETLTASEIATLLKGRTGLVQFKGKWVEVDPAKLQQALDHLSDLRRHNPDGLPILKAMRLLAGLPLDPTAAAAAAPDAEWFFSHPGPWLADRLADLRRATGQSLAPGLDATLRPYQEAGVHWLAGMRTLGLGACLADDMGLGKTLQVIALLWNIRAREKTAGPALLVAPASLLPNWRAEVAKFAPSLRLHLAHSAFDGTAAPAQPVDLTIVSYAQAARLPWLTQCDWKLLILDEAQAIKNPGTAQTKAIKQLPAAHRIALTGTPIENRLGDLWSIMDFLNPGLLGSARDFDRYTRTLDRDANPAAYAPLRKLVAPYLLRRLKTDKSIISDLPDKIIVTAHCHLTKKQAALYREEIATLETALETASGIQRRGLVLASLMRFKQLCNHPDHLAGHGPFDPAASGKFAILADLADEISQRQEKLLVFTQFETMTAPLEAHLAGIFGRRGLILHGGIPVGKRRPLVDAFQDPAGPPFFVLSLKAGGTGLTLTAANHVVHFDRWWNPAVENQATDRAFRIGQKKSVMVHPLVCRGTIEERIDQMLQEKAALADEILEGQAPARLTEMSDKELLDFVRLDLATACG